MKPVSCCLACWTEPAFDTKSSLSQHFSPDISSSLFGCCSSLLSVVLFAPIRLDETKTYSGICQFWAVWCGRGSYFELQNKKQKASYYCHATNRFRWQLKIMNQTCTVCSVCWWLPVSSTKPVYFSKHWQLEQTHGWCNWQELAVSSMCAGKVASQQTHITFQWCVGNLDEWSVFPLWFFPECHGLQNKPICSDFSVGIYILYTLKHPTYMSHNPSTP